MAMHRISFSAYHITEALRLAVNKDIDDGSPSPDIDALIKSSCAAATRRARRDRGNLRLSRNLDSNIRKIVNIDDSVTRRAAKCDAGLIKRSLGHCPLVATGVQLSSTLCKAEASAKPNFPNPACTAGPS